MRVKENFRLSDPECSDVVVKLDLAPTHGEKLRPFIAGQIVRLGLPGIKDPAPGYFAIASEPENRDCYEFVIKERPGIAYMLASQDVGAMLEVDGPMGKGFDLSPYKGSDVYLVGVGTGIAPLRSIWRHLIDCREDFGRIAIYAGFLTPVHRLLTDELESLSDHDIEVSVSVTNGGEDWDGPIGYVQDTLKADRPDGTHAVACLAGMNAMVDACTETLQNLGFDDSRILLNY
ncbi:MAG TPA: hydrogenase [Mariprofundaceae bacterium]|nr:hydrogenase [Mariprofundaceae bacterium]